MEYIEGYWRDIPGIRGIRGWRYQAGMGGEVRTVYKSGKTRTLSGRVKTPKRGARCLMVKIRGKEMRVPHLVAMAFLGPIPPGARVVHKNGIHGDNRPDNLEYVTKREMGLRHGGKNSRSRSVFKIAPDGEVVEVYRSARQAAREAFMSCPAVLDRCNGRVKNEFALTGFSYRWEDPKPGRRRQA